MSAKDLSRRSLLKIGAALGGGLLAQLYLPDADAAEPDPKLAPATFRPNAWLRLDDRRATFICSQAEMGQGVMTSLATILCEELDYDPQRVTVEFAPVDHVYDNPVMGVQGTGGSTSIKIAFTPLREAGAAARDLLLRAAARKWDLPAAELSTSDGVVTHPGGKSATYHELADAASKLSVKRVALKHPSTFKYIGKKVARLDVPAKTNGTAIFGMDVIVPDLRIAVVVRCPVIGGTVKSVDDAAAKAMPGVEAIVPLDYGVGIVATSYWHARQAAEKLLVTWNEGPLATLSSAGIREGMVKSLAAGPGKLAKKEGDAEQAIASAAKKVTAVYEAPYLAHATMEPMNCTAHVTEERCEIWAPTQSVAIAENAAMKITGLSHDQIVIHTTFLGGGFGRRVGFDFVGDAVRISRAVKKPVKVVWSREDDLRFGQFRPGSYHELAGGLDAQGNVVGITHKLASPGVLTQLIDTFIDTILSSSIRPVRAIVGGLVSSSIKAKPDGSATEGAATTRYELPNHRVDYYKDDPGVPLAFWRSVGHSFNAFVMEGFIDELAHAGGRDPLELRRQLLKFQHRDRWVLELVAEKAGWGTKLPRGVFRGIAQHHSFDSWAAAVAEVSVEEEEIKVRRVVVAIDCGRVVNPDTVAAQLESSVIFGMSAALKQQITFARGGVEQSNFNDYPVVRINEAPVIETYFVKNEAAPSGVGEPAVPTIAPAIANAIFAATGKRLRKLPLSLAESAPDASAVVQ